jgi:hypothetical protein
VRSIGNLRPSSIWAGIPYIEDAHFFVAEASIRGGDIEPA